MNNESNFVTLLHANPTETILDIAILSDRFRLDIAGERVGVINKLDDNADIDIVVVDNTTIDTDECKQVLRALSDRDTAALLLTSPNPGPEVLRFDADAHLAVSANADTVAQTIERLREQMAVGTTGGETNEPGGDLDPSHISTEPLYRRYPREFYGLWFLAAATYGIGDIVSTVLAVFADPGLVESNPVVSIVLAEYGVLGFLIVKFMILVTLLWISVDGARSSDRFTYYWPPVVATAVGIALTGWNLWLLYGGG
jgi:hypothetical protein